MFNPVKKLSHVAFAPLFIVGAKTALDNASGMAPMIEGKAKQVGVKKLPVPAEQLIQVNAAAQMGLSSALALGIFPRLAAMGLVGSLVPTTLAGHAFWEEKDASAKHNQLLQFTKNTAVIGGLLAVIVEEGKNKKVRKLKKDKKSLKKSAKSED